MSHWDQCRFVCCRFPCRPCADLKISELLGPGQGRDAEAALLQLWSVMDIPTDHSLPVNIYHPSARDYVADPSNCSILPQVQHAPHSILAYSTLRLMTQDIPESTALLDGTLRIEEAQSGYATPGAPGAKRLVSLVFIVQPPELLQVLMGLLWLRGDRSPGLDSWLETLNGDRERARVAANMWRVATDLQRARVTTELGRV